MLLYENGERGWFVRYNQLKVTSLKVLSHRLWQEERVRCFLGLNVAPARPHWRWFNIKAIKSHWLLSQYIVSEFKLSSIQWIRSQRFYSGLAVTLIARFSFSIIFFKCILIVSVFIIKAVKQKQEIKERQQCCWGINRCRVGLHFISTLWPPNTFRSFYGAVSQTPRPHPCSLKPVQHCFSCVDENGPAENIQMPHPWFIVVPQYSWNCVISHGLECFEVRVNRATSLFCCIVIFVDSTFKYCDNKLVVIHVATAPPSSAWGNRSDPQKAIGYFLKPVNHSTKSG